VTDDRQTTDNVQQKAESFALQETERLTLKRVVAAERLRRSQTTAISSVEWFQSALCWGSSWRRSLIDGGMSLTQSRGPLTSPYWSPPTFR